MAHSSLERSGSVQAFPNRWSALTSLSIWSISFWAWDVLEDLPPAMAVRAPPPLIMAILGVGVALHLVVYLANSAARRITITPRTITVVRGFLPIPMSIMWADIESISSVRANRGGGTVTLRTRTTSRERSLRVNLASSSIGAPAAYWMLRFYHQHPEYRAELGDHRAAARVFDYGLVDRPIGTDTGASRGLHHRRFR